jgi:UDP-2-acetamido-2-deoxy-ribo-hexuluronate aminotransferase
VNRPFLSPAQAASRDAVVDGDAEVVPFFTQAATFEALWPLICSHLNDVMNRGKYSHGHKVAEFEAALAEWTGARYVVGVNSGTDALVLLLRACGLAPGEEVIVPAFSFIASASSVVLARGRPVFADIDPRTYAIDPTSIADVVTARTRMVMPVHLFCQMADMQGVLEVAGRHDLTVLEDSAEAIGMRWGGVHAGLLGVGGVLSFFPAKTLGAIGDAGAVLTDDPQVAETVAAMRHHGRFGQTLANFPLISNPTAVAGINSKMDDIQAAVLTAKLTRLSEEITHRAELAAAYTDRLRGVSGIVRLPTVVPRDVETKPVFYVYLIEVQRRDELATYLANQGVETETFYPTPLHLQPCFADLGYSRGDFPHSEAVCDRAIALPLYPDLSLADLDRVCDVIRRFFMGRQS